MTLHATLSRKGKRATSKATYLLHGPANDVLARCRATSHYCAAMKAAANDHAAIRVRRAGDKIVYLFEGNKVPVPEHERQGRQIGWKDEGRVKYLGHEPFVPKQGAAPAPGPGAP